MPWLELGVAILCLSLPALLVRWAEAPVEVIGFWRLALACAALAPWAWPRRRVWTGAGLARTAAAGALFFLHLWTFTRAAQTTTVANLMLAFSTHPLWTGLGAWLLWREPLGRRELAAFALAGAGIAALFGGAASPGADAGGDFSALLSALFFSGWVLAGSRARRGLDNASFVFAAYATAGLLFAAAGAARGVAWTGHPPRTWAALAGLAFLVSLGGHALFTRLYDRLPVTTLSVAKLLEPALAALAARWLFGEPLPARVWTAFALIGGGVLVLSRRR